MVLINNLTIDEINAALIRLQRSQTEVVGGEKGTTINNITVNSESSGGGYSVDYSSLLKRITTRLEGAEKSISSNEKNISKQEAKNKEQQQQIEEIEALLNGLTSMQITQFSFDEETRTLYLVTNDMSYEVSIPSETVTLELNTTTNKLTFTMGEQEQEVTLPYINSSEKGSANGVATLDGQGRVPYSQLPESAMEFLGQWNASTNTPHLADGTGTNGDFYIVSTGGTVNLGTEQNPHIITFSINDRIVYEGDIAQWVRLPAGQVSSVNGQSGDVTLTASDIEYSTGVSIKDKIDANAVQSDWNVTDTTSLAYIKNKPSVAVLGNTVAVELAPTASAGTTTTAARSDHVHTYPLRMWISNCSGIRGFGARWSSAGYTCLFSTDSTGACTDNNVRVRYADCSGYATCVCTCAFNTAYDFDVKLTNSASSQRQYDWVSSACRLRFCNTTGEFRITNADSSAIAGTMYASCFCGNASTSTSTGLVRIQGDGTDNPDTGYPDTGFGIYKATNYNIGWVSNDGMIMHIPWSTSYGFQIAVDNQSNWIAVRSKAPPAVGQPGAWSSWAQIITADNIGSQSVASADSVDGYHADTSSCSNLIRVTRGSDVGFGASAYCAGMACGNIDGRNKWWHILSMDWIDNDPTNWQSQLLLPTQDGGVPKYRRNNSGGTAITSSTWHNFITDENISSQSVACADHAVCADHATSADVGTLSWTSVGCGVYISGCLARFEGEHIEYDCDWYKGLHCFLETVVGEIPASDSVISVIGQARCTCGICKWEQEVGLGLGLDGTTRVIVLFQAFGSCGRRHFSESCSRVQCINRMRLLATRY